MEKRKNSEALDILKALLNKDALDGKQSNGGRKMKKPNWVPVNSEEKTTEWTHMKPQDFSDVASHEAMHDAHKIGKFPMQQYHAGTHQHKRWRKSRMESADLHPSTREDEERGKKGDHNSNWRGDELGTIERYQRRLRHGMPIPVPSLGITRGGKGKPKKVTGHEGRHRAEAAAREGLKTIPVGISDRGTLSAGHEKKLNRRQIRNLRGEDYSQRDLDRKVTSGIAALKALLNKESYKDRAFWKLTDEQRHNLYMNQNKRQREAWAKQLEGKRPKILNTSDMRYHERSAGEDDPSKKIPAERVGGTDSQGRKETSELGWNIHRRGENYRKTPSEFLALEDIKSKNPKEDGGVYELAHNLARPHISEEEAEKHKAIDTLKALLNKKRDKVFGGKWISDSANSHEQTAPKNRKLLSIDGTEKFGSGRGTGYRAYVDPKDFLKLTTTNNKYAKRARRDYGAKYRKNTGTMYKPTLWVDHKTGEVRDHEGRTRARAAIDNKLGMIPVDVIGHNKHQSVRHIPFHKLRGQRSDYDDMPEGDSPDQKKRRSNTARKVRQGMEALKALQETLKGKRGAKYRNNGRREIRSKPKKERKPQHLNQLQRSPNGELLEIVGEPSPSQRNERDEYWAHSALNYNIPARKIPRSRVNHNNRGHIPASDLSDSLIRRYPTGNKQQISRLTSLSLDTARKLKSNKQQMEDEENYMISQGEIPEVKTLPNQFWEKHRHEDSPHIKYLKIHTYDPNLAAKLKDGGMVGTNTAAAFNPNHGGTDEEEEKKKGTTPFVYSENIKYKVKGVPEQNTTYGIKYSVKEGFTNEKGVTRDSEHTSTEDRKDITQKKGLNN